MATILPNTFVPTSISGCQLWVDAADSSSVVLSGVNVISVSDKSGNGKNITGGSGFTYNDTKFNSTYPSFYTSSTGVSLGSNTSFSVSQPVTIFAVGQSLAAAGAFPVLADSTSGSRIVPYFWNSGGFRVRLFAGSEIEYISGATTFVNSYYANTTNSQIFQYGISLVSGNIGTGSFNGIQLATSFVGHFCEFLVYNSILSNTQRLQMEGYLSWKWGLQGNLPASHPFRYAPPNASGSAISLTVPISVPRQNFQPNPSPIVFFNPLTVSGAVMWLDGLDNSKLVLSGTSVTQWIDKTGYGYNMSTTSGTVTRTTANGFPVLSFPSGAIMSSVTVSFYGSVFIVCQPTQQSGQGLNMLIGPAGSGLAIRYDSTYKLTNPGDSFDIGQNGAYIVNGTSIGTTNPSLNTQLNIIYTPIVNGFSGVATISNTFMSRYFIGNMCEILLFSSSLSTTNRQLIEGYLAWKWGIQGSLPASHPYKNTIPGNTILTTIPANTNMRSASFRPTGISGCTLWLDGADISKFVLSGSTVVQWNDKSGNGYSASGGVSPTYDSNGVLFNGSTQYMSVSSSAFPSGNNASTYFYVVRPNQTTPVGAARVYLTLSTDANAATNPYNFYIAANNKWSIYQGSIEGQFTTNPVLNQSALLDYVYTQGIAITGYLNGSLELNQSQASMSVGNTYAYIGGRPSISTWWYSGYISEIIVYNTSLTTSQRQSVEGYLAWKWGIQGNLPATHPFKKFPPPPN